MFWTDDLVKKLDRDKKHLVSDAWSTSGYAHIGSLRGAAIHNVAFKALDNEGFNVEYKWLMDDFDPLDGIPVFVDGKKYREHMGKPLSEVPAPNGEGSYAEYFAKDFKGTLDKNNIKPTILWTSKLYKEGLLNDGIKTALDNAEKIREIYKKISGSERPKDWYPFSPICEKCGKIGTTKVYDWDGKEVSYRCEEKAVEWAEGCRHDGKMSPFDGNGKIPWRVEWAVRQKVLGTTVEGEGKDHWSAGGSRDMLEMLAKEVFKFKTPYDIRYDFFLLEGKKMSSSKGKGITAKDISSILPVPILNYLLTENPKRVIEFNPEGDTIVKIFDTYDRAREAYFRRIDFPDIAKAFSLSQIDKPEDGYRMRFSKVAFGIQMPKLDLDQTAEEEKGSKLTKSEKDDLNERIEYAKKWLDEYAPENYIFKVQEKLPKVSLSNIQKEFLKELRKNLENIIWKGEGVHAKIHDVKNDMGIAPKEAFQALYLIFLDKESGPQAGWLLSSLDKDFALKRLEKGLK